LTIECSVRTAWEAIYLLLKRGPAPPPVYQSQYDPKALIDALKVFDCEYWHQTDAPQAFAMRGNSRRKDRLRGHQIRVS